MACFGGINFCLDNFGDFILFINYMGFFGSKNKDEKEVATAEVQEKVEREIIVHNMPSQKRALNEIINKNNGSSLSLDARANYDSSSELNSQINNKKDFKVMGFFIIFMGFIFIALIVFLTYRFVISPTATPKEARLNIEANQNIISESLSNEEVEEEIVINDSEIDINQEASNLNVNTTGTLGGQEIINSDVMQEEFQGQDAVNLSPLIDSDNDGLYDEEEILFGSSIFLSDSDGDGYDDLSEIRNNYNPSGTGALADSAFISIYRNFNYNFNFLYPNTWELKEVSDKLIIFEDKDSSLVQLAIMDNADKLSILNWYETTFPEEVLVYDKLISKPGYEGVISKSGLDVYLTNEARTTIFVFSYIPASSERLAFMNIFEMIYSSFGF